MFRAKTKEQAVLEALNNLAAKSSITQLNPGGKARAVLEAIGQFVGDLSADTSDGIMQTLINDATGPTLDLIAEGYGLQRLAAVPPQVESTDSSLKYYVRRGTFGDINAGNNISIPKGAQIRSDSDTAGVYFVQRDDITLSAGDSEEIGRAS